MSVESPVEQTRRAWVARQEEFRDRGEEYERNMAAATTAAERDSLMKEFSAYRTAHRLEDIETGKRPSGTAVMMRQVMWARWIEIAVTSELQAREEFRRFISEPESGALAAELKASLVCVAACAHTIEALYGDIKYLIPAPTRRGDTRDQRLNKSLIVAFGLPDDMSQGLRRELAWLFKLRDFVVHPYTEFELPKRHPSGANTGAEAAQFNAVECVRAVDLVMHLLSLARQPPAPRGRWIERWVEDRGAHHDRAIDPLRSLRSAAPPVP